MIIREVSVVYKSHIYSREWMRSCRMPYPSLGREALMCNPCMSLKLSYLIIINNRLGKTYNLKNHYIPPMREHKRPFITMSRIIYLIQFKTVLVQKLILCFPAVYSFQPVFSYKPCKNIIFYADKISADIGRFHFKSRYCCPVIDLIEHG